MPNHLVIVESPAKGRTIERYLGPSYQVLASFGHVRDLPSNRLGVDVKHDFKPEYELIPRAKKAIARLKKSLQKVDDVYLATDFDREGEAIAWHVVYALGLNDHLHQPTTNNQPKKSRVDSRQLAIAVKRVTFHEITKSAIEEAVKKPRLIDLNLVDAQQGRRVLDRLVGYKLSPFLWKKVVSGLSAGRVQSVTVRLIVDRERAIDQFKPTEYWSIHAHLLSPKDKQDFMAELSSVDGQSLDKFSIANQQQAEHYRSIFERAVYQVGSIKHGETKKYPYPPFTTSTLQQEANHRLAFSSKKTMKLAQDLYEAGKITYMRTDSTNLSWVAINTARQYINKQLGSRYLPEKPRLYRPKSLFAQEAHEAIRPTYLATEAVTGQGWTEDHQKLYQLIWSRTIACQMKEATVKTITVAIQAKVNSADIAAGVFVARGQTVDFEGFTKIYPIKIEELSIPSLSQGQSLAVKSVEAKEHFTKPPDRYTEATLVKALEEHGIGRPSTYAPIIATIQERGYVWLQNRFFYPREIGTIVNDLLVAHFPEIVDIDFTAAMEKDLDLIAQGEKRWEAVVKAFYTPFEKRLIEKEKAVKRVSFEKEEAGQTCPKCGQPMVVRISRYGKFLACSGYPKCRTTKYLVQSTGLACPDCQVGEVVERYSRQRKIFWGCSRYPECRYASWTKPNLTSRMPESPRMH